ncbi:MAG: glycosyltransferase family 4 protein, partial [Gallionella sp.]|nr:glycosyltransferase family 4 protein [Gallionella sp.]
GPLISALVAQGVEVLAIAPDYDEQTRESVRALGAVPVDYSLTRTGMTPLRDALDTIRLALLLRRLGVDATLGYSIKPVIYGTFAALLARVPRRFCMIEGLGYVFTPPAGREPTKRKVLRSLVSLLYKWALKYAPKVFLLNDDDIAELVGRGLVRSAQVVKLGGIGVDLAEWLPALSVNQPITFLLAARLLREKGIVEYAEAARLVKNKYPSTRFILLGGLDPNPGGLSEGEVAAWVEQGLLEWPGHVPVKDWLAQASVYVLPSYREGVPRSTQEAMAMGRAVITTRAPGCRETVVDGENGFLVPVRDPVALAEAMTFFIEQPELIEIMGKASRALAIERFDVRKVNAVMLAAMGMAK